MNVITTHKVTMPVPPGERGSLEEKVFYTILELLKATRYIYNQTNIAVIMHPETFTQLYISYHSSPSRAFCSSPHFPITHPNELKAKYHGVLIRRTTDLEPGEMEAYIKHENT